MAVTAPPSYTQAPAGPSDWDLTTEYLKRHPTRWGALNWIAARPLISSLNHLFVHGAGQIVRELRNNYLATSPNPSLLINSPQVTDFVVIGDTGEQDPSQYVVAPQLSRVVRETASSFVLVASDVIYPSGDVNEYVDGVYRTYRSDESDQFRVDATIYGQPGNHDWYDGLAGFMYHFCEQDRPTADWYAPTSASPIQRLFRILWRRSSIPTADTAAARRRYPLTTDGSTQPGPYFAIDTAHLRVVSIDTGIVGTIDPEQMRWLERVSAGPRPKLLVTGSPLLVDANREPCAVEPAEPGLTASVWDLVHNPANNYVATMGGDIHNFQRYQGLGIPNTPQLHLVNGGGGAFMAAMHPIDLAPGDSRTDLSVWHPYPDLTFPTTHESFAFFGRQIVPSVWRMLRLLLLFVLGTATTTAVALFGSLVGPTDTLLHWLTLGTLGVAVVVVIARTAMRRLSRSSRWKRAIVAICGFLAGILAPLLVMSIDQPHWLAYEALWLGASLWHILAGWGISRTGWWLPRTDHPAEREVHTAWFLLGLVIFAGIGFGAQFWFFRTLPQLIIAGIATAALLAVFIAGWIIRRNGGGRWRKRGATVAILVQLAYFAVVVLQLAISDHLLAQYFGGLLGIVVFLGMLLVMALLMVGLTELATVPARIRGGNVRRAWGKAAMVMHQLPLLLLIGLVVGWCLVVDGDLLRAAIAVPIALNLLFVSLFGTDFLRRWLPNGYKVLVLLLVAGTAYAAYHWRGWAVDEGLSAVLVLTAVGVTVVLAHLVFLGAHRIFFDGAAHRGDIVFTPEQLTEIFAAKIAQPQPRVPQVPRPQARWAQLTYPGVGEPGGPLQANVAEIYSSDEPPFFKQFVHLRTTPQQLIITLHMIFGDRPSQSLVVGQVSLV